VRGAAFDLMRGGKIRAARQFGCALRRAALAGMGLHGLVRVRLGASAALREFFDAAIVHQARRRISFPARLGFLVSRCCDHADAIHLECNPTSNGGRFRADRSEKCERLHAAGQT
jgi:hypothetical protein